jgi:UDP-2,4-diacetamido-2,4,6-trideoxy-beta-L-altropyranose hydrolase
MKVAFRVDASPAIGIGHFMRCLCLADALSRQGATIRFVSRGLPVHLRGYLDERRYQLTPLAERAAGRDAGDLAHSSWLGATQADDAADTRAALAPDTGDWVVVDHYALDARWETALRAQGSRILAIDDIADRGHDCDVLLDQNLYADPEQRYAGKVPDRCRLLLGPRYALLRDEFQQARLQAPPRTGIVARILVSFGGVDAANCTGAALEALRDAAAKVDVDVVIGAEHAFRADIERVCERSGYRLHVQSNRMAELMARADLAIGAAGITTWERCCVGLPAVAVAIAANQRAVVEGAADEGLLYMPGHDVVTSDGLAVHLRALVDNPRLLQLMSRRAMHAVDGRGVERVLRVLGQQQHVIQIREATAADASGLFEWRNHESVRRMSRQPDAIAWPAHEAWLHGVLADRDRLLVIGEREGAAVGVVRFDVADDRAEVSIYRVPGTGEPGIGSSVLAAAEQWLSARRPELALLTAEVLGENERSHHLFRSTGYRLRSARYEKRLHA